ncbi:hypothetical protein [Clostridium hydrogeniformans]|uniref:hypothetical protein n=1 Tax=Clostridium hydrogeniformans TaxID=349933 RepID=UPI00048267BE|nr:hypothetical protein [Clostridium hydrogeniformans]
MEKSFNNYKYEKIEDVESTSLKLNDKFTKYYKNDECGEISIYADEVHIHVNCNSFKCYKNTQP